MTLKPVILLVDDDADARMLIRDAIAAVRKDSEVREVSGAPEAMEYLRLCGCGDRRPRPDLIFLDIEMSGMSGQAVLQLIKTQRDLRDIPVVMLTGVDDEDQKRLAALNGANSYILKPSDPASMLRAVRMATDYWLNLHQLCKV